MTPVKVPVYAQKAVQIELSLEPGPFSDDGVYEGVIGEPGVAQSVALPLTFAPARSGVIRRKFMGST